VKEFTVLIGQLLLIVCIQALAKMFIDASKAGGMGEIVSAACYAGGLYLLLQFVFSYILGEVVNFVQGVF